MSGELRLSSFEVEGFRAIRRLSLPVLGRVNLFVGENNAGKSSLLEALQLYLHRNDRALPAMLLQVTRDHSDFRPPGFSRRGSEISPLELRAALEAAEGLFHGSFNDQPVKRIRLHPDNPPSDELVISLVWLDSEDLAPERPVAVDPSATLIEVTSATTGTLIPVDWFTRRIPVLPKHRRFPSLTVPASGLESSRVRQTWDQIAVAGDEGLVEEAVRMIVPELERIVVVGETGLRSVLCKVSGVERPIPIRSMGDGTNRVFGLAVALVASRGGALLIDEVENGLHRSVHNDIWKLIFDLSARLDVQVFATTHGWEAVVGFQAAANASPALGMLYRLEREPDGEIYAEQYTEEEVAIATEHQIEVR